MHTLMVWAHIQETVLNKLVGTCFSSTIGSDKYILM